MAAQSLHFLHVPKTAGTALRTYLSSKYPSEATVITDDVDDFRSRLDHRRDELRLLCTHLGPAAATEFSEPPATGATYTQ